MTAAAPHEVSRFEFNLVRLVRFAVGHFPADQGLQLVRATLPRPACLSRTAVRLVEDGLSKGCVLHLVRAGAWRVDRYLRDGGPVRGRVWDRVPVEERGLTFSRHVLDFLVWLTAERPTDTRVSWDAPAGNLTPADELFFFLVFDACRPDPEVTSALARKEVFRRNALCWLSGPADVSDADDPAVPDFGPWFAGERAVWLECLQPALAARWVRSEREKGQVGDWVRMRRRGRAEYATLGAYIMAAERAGRPDLARFVLHANAALLAADLAPAFWTGGLGTGGPPRLADRLDAQRAALAVPRQMDALVGWQERARYVGFFDDGYAVAQMWKADWEAADGDAVAARARRAVDQLEPLRATGGERGEGTNGSRP